MSPQDQVERVLKDIHVYFAKCERCEDDPRMVRVDQKEFLKLLERLNYGIFDIMESYEQTRSTAGETERAARRQGDQILEDAQKKADDVYAASLLFTSESINGIRDIMDEMHDSVNDQMRRFKKELFRQRQQLQQNETELRSQLADLADTRKYLQVLEDINHEHELKKRNLEEEKAAGRAFAEGLRNSGRNPKVPVTDAAGALSEEELKRQRSQAPGADDLIDLNEEPEAQLNEAAKAAPAGMEKLFTTPEAAAASRLNELGVNTSADNLDIRVNKDAAYFKWKEEQEQEAREVLKKLQEEEAREAEQKAAEEARKQQERERVEKMRQEQAEERARKEAEERARLEAEREAEEKRRAEEEAAQKAAREEAERKAAEEKAAAEQAAREEAERKAAEEKAAAEQAAREEAERKAAEEKAAAEQTAREEAERKAAEEKAAAEQAAREEAERKAAEEKEDREQKTRDYSFRDLADTLPKSETREMQAIKAMEKTAGDRPLEEIIEAGEELPDEAKLLQEVLRSEMAHYSAQLNEEEPAEPEHSAEPEPEAFPEDTYEPVHTQERSGRRARSRRKEQDDMDEFYDFDENDPVRQSKGGLGGKFKDFLLGRDLADDDDEE